MRAPLTKSVLSKSTVKLAVKITALDEIGEAFGLTTLLLGLGCGWEPLSNYDICLYPENLRNRLVINQQHI